MKTAIEQRFADIIDNGDLLRVITPDTDPEEAIARLQEYNRRDLKPAAIEKHKQHLREAGVKDWETWEYYSSPSISDSQEKSLAFLRDNWPPEIESLLVPGQWSGGTQASDVQYTNVRIVAMTGPAKFDSRGHTIYLRVAPQGK